MKQYLELVQKIIAEGTKKEDRTGTGTTSIFGHQMRFDLSEGFPLVTTKKCHVKSIIHELLWFLSGDTNIRYLQENGVKIWDEWADENGDLGPVYGSQWRSWPTEPGQDSIDQISNLISMIKGNPDSRRLIVSAWNPAEIDEMALPPCHTLFQFYSREMPLAERIRYAPDAVITTWQLEANYIHESLLTDLDQKYVGMLDNAGIPTRKLSCQLYQRSADVFLGVPFNIASYALLTMMVAQVTDHAPGEFIWTGGDCHLYSNHMEQAALQLTKEPRPLPTMQLNPQIKDIFDFTYDDFSLVGYDPHPAIKAPVAV